MNRPASAKSGTVSMLKGNRATVSIDCGGNGCAGCRLTPLCGKRDEKIEIEAEVPPEVRILPGDRVEANVTVKGWFSGWMFMAGLPTLAILVTVVVAPITGADDLTTGLMCLGELVIWGGGIWAGRKHIDRKARWVITKKLS